MNTPIVGGMDALNVAAIEKTESVLGVALGCVVEWVTLVVDATVRTVGLLSMFVLAIHSIQNALSVLRIIISQHPTTPRACRATPV